MTSPGLARQRTALAWNRTALACFALAALLVKLAIARDRPFEGVAGGVALAEAVLLWRLQPVAVDDNPSGRPTRRVLLAAAATGTTVALTAISLFA